MKNIKSLIFISLGMLLSCCSQKTKLVETKLLSELTNPHEIISDNDHLIISDGVEGTTIFVYSIENLSLYSKFGGTGDSTGMFKVSGGHEVGIDIKDDTLLISSHWKTSYFKKDGKLIKEHPIKTDTYGYRFLGDNFTGMDDTTENNVMFYTFNLYDTKFKYIKEITRIAGSNQGEKGLQVLVRKYQGMTYKDKYYLKGKSNDGEIEVYDLNGDKETVFTQQIKRVLVNEEHKNDILKMYKEHPLFGKFFEIIKKRIIFPEYLPAIYDFKIADDFIYILTYKKEGANTLMYKLDLNGNLIEKIEVPVKWKGPTEIIPYTIANKCLYQIAKNESDEWELQIIEL